MASDRTCPHSDAERLQVSGTQLREWLAKGADVPPEFSRPEVLAVLKEYYAGLETAAPERGQEPFRSQRRRLSSPSPRWGRVMNDIHGLPLARQRRLHEQAVDIDMARVFVQRVSGRRLALWRGRQLSIAAAVVSANLRLPTRRPDRFRPWYFVAVSSRSDELPTQAHHLQRLC